MNFLNTVDPRAQGGKRIRSSCYGHWRGLDIDFDGLGDRANRRGSINFEPTTVGGDLIPDLRFTEEVKPCGMDHSRDA